MIVGRLCEVMHEVRLRAPKRHRALIAVDEGLLGGIDQAVHETGVAVGDVAPVSISTSTFFITNRIVLRRLLHARLNMPPRLHHHQLSLL